MDKSTANGKPKKPNPNFPLFPHATRRWAKKVRGKLHYFGPWRDPDAALALWLDQKDDLLAGRTPRVSRDGLTVADLVNRFLDAKRSLMDSDELSPRTWKDYFFVCGLLVAAFGRNRLVDDLAADDFERLRASLAKGRGPVALRNMIMRAKVVFKFATDNQLVTRAIAYGQSFRVPSLKMLRKARADRGPRIFEVDELRKIIDAARQPLKAMVLLGINAGLGQSDISNLPQSAIDFKGGWLNYPRPKTGIDRRCPLWPETMAALHDALKVRPAPRDPADQGLVFLTAQGLRCTRTTKNGRSVDSLSYHFGVLLKELGMNGQRGFYCLRRSFRTIADGSRDATAAAYIMGHAPSSSDMGAVYVRRIDDERLVAVTDFVRTWLFSIAAVKKS